MSDTPDPCDLLFPPGPPHGDERLRETLRLQTTRAVRWRRWRNRVGLVAAVAAIYLAGLLTPRPFGSPPIPERPVERPVEPGPAGPTPPESIASALDLEYRALESEQGRAELYRIAGDRYLLEKDMASAVRCYRLALDESSGDLAVQAEDTWLLIALKDARKKEKANAIVRD
jgi:hypothetical protein